MTTAATPNGVNLETVRQLLDELGIRPRQLIDEAGGAPTIPTFDDYIDRVSSAVSKATLRVYGPYWRRLKAVWGTRLIDEPKPSELKQFVLVVKENVVVRRNARGGRTAMEHMVGAFRCLYAFAVDDGLIKADENPSARVQKPRRLPSNRYALTSNQLAQINEIAATTGNDPALDALLLRLHTETACRRGGALALRLVDLNVEQCLVRLREKGDTERDQPVSPTLMRALLTHAEERGGEDEHAQLLRYANGAPLTRRRYDHLWERIGRHLPWVRTQGVTMHWIRHTTLRWVERRFSYAVARAFAGHTDGARDAGTTTTYVRAQVDEVAAAVAAMTGEPHPMAP